MTDGLKGPGEQEKLKLGGLKEAPGRPQERPERFERGQERSEEKSEEKSEKRSEERPERFERGQEKPGEKSEEKEKLRKIMHYEKQKEKYNVKYKPQLTRKFAEVFEKISASLAKFDVEVDEPSIAVAAEAKKYREKGCVVYPAVLRESKAEREGKEEGKAEGKAEARLYFVYRNESGVVDRIDARSAPLLDVLSVSQVIGEFQSMVEEAIVDAMLKKSEEDYRKITSFMKRAAEAYKGYNSLLDTIKSIQGIREAEVQTRSQGQGQSQSQSQDQEQGQEQKHEQDQEQEQAQAQSQG